MPPQLFGAIASSNSPALAAPAKRAGAQTSSLAFPGGYLTHAASARLFSDRGLRPEPCGASSHRR